MDQSIKRREMVEKWRASDKKIKPAPAAPLAGTMQVFASEQERQRHLEQVAEAQRLGAPF